MQNFAEPPVWKAPRPIIVTLQRKIERFEHVATRVQAIMDKAASVLEAFLGLFRFTDYTITAIVMMALTALWVLIWTAVGSVPTDTSCFWHLKK